MTVKAKNVNAYIKANGKKVVCITLEDGNVVFVNEALLAYACQNAKEIKQK